MEFTDYFTFDELEEFAKQGKTIKEILDEAYKVRNE